MAKVFISPSTQDWNQYAGGGTGVADSEETWMRKVASVAAEVVRANGHTVAIGGKVSAADNASNANAWGAQWYIAVHSNAGGGRGTEAWYYTGSEKGKRIAQAVYNRVAPVSNQPDRGVKSSTGYIELRKPKAPATIVEVAFHDNVTEAAEIRSDYAEFGRAVADGILDVVGRNAPAPIAYYEVRIHTSAAEVAAYKALAAAHGDFCKPTVTTKDSWKSW